MRIRDWRLFATATYTDPDTGMAYLSVGRTPLRAHLALSRFLVAEPEIS